MLDTGLWILDFKGIFLSSIPDESGFPLSAVVAWATLAKSARSNEHQESSNQYLYASSCEADKRTQTRRF